MDEDSVEIPLSALVRTTPQRNAGLSWPLPVDRRLDDLVQLATAAGENTTRKELVAAAIASLSGDPEDLTRILKRYRLMRVGELLESPSEDSPTNVVILRQNRPGPRKQAGTS